MAHFLDSIPFSGIIRIRDMMYARRESVPPRPGRRQLRRARHGQGGDGAGDRRQPHALPADDRRAAAAGAAGREAAREERHPGRIARRSAGHQRRHPRPLHPVPGAARARRRGDHPRPAVAADGWHHPGGARRAGALPAARGPRLALRPRRARGAHHAADTRDLPQLAAQPDRRRADARGSRGDRRLARRAQPAGSSRTRPTRTSSSTAQHVSIASLAGHVRAHAPGLHLQQVRTR